MAHESPLRAVTKTRQLGPRYLTHRTPRLQSSTFGPGLRLPRTTDFLQRPQPSRDGFTLIELLVVVGILGILSSLLLPALSRAKSSSRSAICLNNSRQLAVAIQLYAEEHEEAFPPNPDDNPVAPLQHWCSGKAGRGQPNEFDHDILRDPEHSLLAIYVSRETKIYRCPEDRRTGRSQGSSEPSTQPKPKVPAARTISMNQAIGTNPKGNRTTSVDAPWLDGKYGNKADSGPFRVFPLFSSLVTPGPAMTWTLMDEDPSILNDASFAFSMVGMFYLDRPGSYHHGAGRLTFADGHSELRRWMVRPGTAAGGRNAAIEKDWTWLRDRTSAPW